MDSQTIFTSAVTSLLFSSIIVIGIAFLLKKSLNTALDLRFEKLIKLQRIQLQKLMRRNVALYDEKLEALKHVLAITDKLRNPDNDLTVQLARDKESKRGKLEGIYLESQKVADTPKIDPLDELKQKLRENAFEHAYSADIRIDDAAKSLITLVGLLQGLFVLLFASGNLLALIKGWLFIPFILVAITFIGSLVSSAMVFTSPMYRVNLLSSSHWKAAYEEFCSYKYRWLRLGQLLFIIGSALMLILIIVGVLSQP